MLACLYQIYLFANLCIPKWLILNPIQDGSSWRCTWMGMAESAPPQICCTYLTKVKHITVSIPCIFHSKSAIFDASGYNNKTNTFNITHFVIFVTAIDFFTIALVNMTPFLLMSVKLSTSGLLKITQNLEKRWQIIISFF